MTQFPLQLGVCGEAFDEVIWHGTGTAAGPLAVSGAAISLAILRPRLVLCPASAAGLGTRYLGTFSGNCVHSGIEST